MTKEFKHEKILLFYVVSLVFVNANEKKKNIKSNRIT